MVIAALVVLLVSAALSIRYGLGVASSQGQFGVRLSGSFLAAIGVAGLYFGISLLRALLDF